MRTKTALIAMLSLGPWCSALADPAAVAPSALPSAATSASTPPSVAASATAPTAKASTAKAPAAKPAPPINVETAGFDPWTAWFAARVAAAKAGKPELIQLPVAIRSQGWGCQCPAAYVGTSANEAMPGPWLALKFENLDGPETGVEGATLLAEGTLTGATEQEDLRNEDGEPEEWLYTLQVFEIQRFRVASFDGDGIAKVVLTGAEMAEKVAPFDDARKHIVVVDRLNRRNADALSKAGAQVQALKAKGFAEAEHFDSRRTPNLWAGTQVVVVGRTATGAEAQTLAAKASSAGLKPKTYIGF